MEILENQTQTKPAGAAKVEPKLNGMSTPMGAITFGSRDVFVMNANQGSSYTNSIASEIATAFGKLPGTKPRINILDKEAVAGLAYSAIIISFKNTNTVNYFTILLEGTGRRPMTANEVTNELAAANVGNRRPMIFTPDEAIDSVLHEQIVKVLASEYNTNEFVNNSGIVVPTHHDDVVILGNNLAAVAHRAITIDAMISSKQVQDLNIRHAIDANPTYQLRIDENFNATTIKNEIGRPIRTDFVVELNAHDVSNNVTSINLQNAKEQICKVGGFIDAIVDIDNTPNPYAQMQPMMQGPRLRLYPHIIITSNETKTPSTGSALLGIVSSLVMLNPGMWLGAVMPKHGKDEHNVAALNISTNIDNLPTPNGVGVPLDLTAKTLSKQEVYSMIKEMFKLSPIISMDIELFGPQSFYNVPFQTACEYNGTREGMVAANEIVEAANWLTAGAFPKTFPLNEIFVSKGVYVPLGTWADKTGEKDIRDVDMSYIANKTGDINAMNKWNLSNLPKDGNGGTEPFYTKIECIKDRIPDAVISGKALRVTFSSKFIMTLSEAVQAAGLNVKYEPAITFGDTYNLQSVSQFMAGASVNGMAHGFARQQTVAGPNYQVFGSNMGMGRY
jgi:hypothetical protein